MLMFHRDAGTPEARQWFGSSWDMTAGKIEGRDRIRLDLLVACFIVNLRQLHGALEDPRAADRQLHMAAALVILVCALQLAESRVIQSTRHPLTWK